MANNVVEALYANALRDPAHPAILAGPIAIRYGQLAGMVNGLARRLRESGVRPGQVVAVSMLHAPRHLMALLALAQVGAVSLPLHPEIPRERRRLAASRFGAAAVLSGREEMALAGLPFIPVKDLAGDAGMPRQADIHPFAADAPMRIMLSSGTSGDPKGMVLTHALAELRNEAVDAALTPRCRVLPMDLNYVIGFRPALGAIVRGATVVFPPSLAPRHVLGALVNQGVTHLLASPGQVRDIADCAPEGAVACPAMECLRIVGGAAGAGLLERVRTRLTANVHVLYGSTESGQVTAAPPDVLIRHPDTVGTVSDWAQVQVVDDEGRELAAGSTGQLRIRSSHQVAGYWGGDRHGQFGDGWFHPGDLGHFDGEGLLYIDGRADEQMNVGGLKVNPEEIDGTLAEHPAVAAAGAFVATDARGRESLAVAIVPRVPGDDPRQAVRAYARERLGPLAPDAYFILPSLPRTATGKLQRRELPALCAAAR